MDDLGVLARSRFLGLREDTHRAQLEVSMSGS